MSQQNRTTLKSYFNTGARPTQEQFADLIDSSLNLAHNGIFDDGGNLGLGHSNPSSRLSVNGGVTVSPNNDNAPGNGLFVHGNVGIGAGFTKPAAQLAVKGGVYIGNTQNTDPGVNSLRVDGNVTAGGSLSVTGSLHVTENASMDGNLTLAGRRYVATNEVRARKGSSLELHGDGGKGLRVKHSSGDVSADGNLTLAGTKHVATDEVWARNSSGLKLRNAGGAGGLMIHGSGHVSIGSDDIQTDTLHVEGSLRVTSEAQVDGNLTVSGSITAESLSLTGRISETRYEGDHQGASAGEYAVEIPENKVVAGLLVRRYTHNSDVYYTFALKYK